MRFPRVASFLLASLFFCLSLTAQQPPQRDLQALSLASRALWALTSGVAVNDVTLFGTATRIAGSDQKTGAAALKGAPLLSFPRKNEDARFAVERAGQARLILYGELQWWYALVA